MYGRGRGYRTSGKERYDDRGGGRGRYSRGGGKSVNSSLQKPTECDVVVNYNKLDIIDPAREVDVHVYKVIIKSASYKVKVDAEGNKMQDPTNANRPWREFVARSTSVNADDTFKKRFFSSMKPWRIYKQLVEDHEEFDLFYDGAEMAIAPSDSCPADEENIYRVCIKQDCEANHPDADKVKNEWYQVTLEKTHTIKCSNLYAAINGGGTSKSTAELSALLNVIMKSDGVKAGMIPLTSQSSTLFFPLENQAAIFRQKMFNTKDGKKMLLGGIKQTTIFSQTGCNVQGDPVVNWFDKEMFNLTDNETKIPIIDKRDSTVAGIRVDFGRLGTDETRQRDIEAALSKLSLNFEYTIKKPNEKKEEVMLKKGKSTSEIKESRRRVVLNQMVKVDKDHTNAKIMWSPRDHEFLKDGKMTTVFEHYRDTYGIQLDENLPIVYIGKHKGWLPLEFAYQVFTKSRDANEPDMVRDILKYYDGIAGTKLRDEIVLTRRLFNSLSRGALAKFNLLLIDEPINIKARVLRDPVIQFDKSNASVKNGSFDLRGVSFASAAEISSFAVVNFADDNAPSEYVSLQLRICNKHGIEISNQTMDVASARDHDGRRYLDNVTETYPKSGRDAELHAPEALHRAVQKARDVFLFDTLGIFGENKVFHKTTCSLEANRKSFKCLIIPPGKLPQHKEDELSLVFEPTSEPFYTDEHLKFYCTHDITMKDGERVCDRTRLKARVRGKNGDYMVVDLFDMETRSGGLEAKGQLVDFVCYVFECHLINGKIVNVDDGDVQQVKALHTEHSYKIHCPSIVFKILPDNGKALYDRVKNLNNNSVGIPTQCIDFSKFRSQRNQDQYASNVAVKINTKLRDSMNKANAWKSSPFSGGGCGIQWVNECPTLVIGIGMVHGMGFGARTVVASNVNLDSECMAFSSCAYVQKKTDVLNKYTMRAIVMESWDKYCSENPSPKRILIYRDGVSDGNFEKVDEEIAHVRDALKIKTGVSCICDHGCSRCCPPITFVICQSQNNTRVLPLDNTQGFQVRGGGVNVHSGTVVDHESIMALGTLRIPSNEDADSMRELNDSDKSYFGASACSYDFLLTAQGGLKGTSKPIYYRVRLNENACWGPSGLTPLTRENLIYATYQMCYEYGSATKVVRELPAIKYAKKLGNQILSGLKYSEEGFVLDGKEYRLEHPRDDLDDDVDNRYYVSVNGGYDNEREVKVYNVVAFSRCDHLAG